MPNDPFQILISTDLTDQGLALLRAAEDVEVQTVNPANVTALREKLATAHALIARDDVVIDKPLLDSAPVLRVIGGSARASAGFDLETATGRGIVVTNTPGVNAIAAGELAITLMLVLSRSVIAAHNSLKSGFWLLDRKRQAGTQLNGKTLGVIGLGRVGMVVAQRCLAFGMTVLAYDPYIGEDQVEDQHVQLVGLSELLRRQRLRQHPRSPTGETRGMFNAKLVAEMKPGARLINTAHGSIIDESAVADAIKSGRLAGAAVDVFAEEPPYNSPLIGLDQVVHTPHIGDNTVEAAQDVSLLIVTQVIDALRGDDYRNVANMPFMPGMDFETARPFCSLPPRSAR